MRIRTVLVPTDLSEAAAGAFPHARAIATRFGAGIVLLYVEEVRLPPPVPDYAVPEIDDFLLEHERRARDQLEHEAAKLGRDLKVEIVTLVGSPHVQIVRTAAERGADLIVMGMHGRDFLSHALLGSTTERVLRRAPCPVLAVREAGHQPIE